MQKVSKWILALVVGALLVGACGPASAVPTPLPTEATGDETIAIPDPTAARDAALVYLAGSQTAGAPSTGLTWTEENITQEGLVGASTFQYTADDWLITVSFPVVAPQATIYHVVVADEASGFRWEADVDAQGQVTATAGPEVQGQATATVTPADQQQTQIELSEEDMDQLVSGNSAFAFDLYQALRERQGNLFYSPYSISLALAMTYAGARGGTEEQMAQTLHYLLSQERLHPAFSALAAELASRGQGAAGKDGEGFRLNVVNALWGQEGYPFLVEFLDLLAANYDAGLTPLDFAADPEAARLTINDWASDQTEGRIQDLVPPGAIDTLTRLVLTNAIYFNAAWALPFEPDLTQDGPFHLLDGSQITVPLMRQTEGFPYAAGEGYQAVELYYDGSEISMVILLPAEGEFQAFEEALDAAQVQAILDGLGYSQVALALPRFEFEADFTLRDTFAAMGMPDAFSDAADFSGMTGNRDLSISEVIHKAFVSVDEAGTEAAAATAVLILGAAAPEEPVEFTVDRPFLFLIRDLGTGTILFIGRVVDPTA